MSVDCLCQLFELPQVEFTAAEQGECFDVVEVSGFGNPDVGHIALFESFKQFRNILFCIGVEYNDLFAFFAVAFAGNGKVAGLALSDLHNLFFELLVRNHFAADF